MALGVLGVLAFLACDARPSQARLPNVLVIVMDTTRGDRCSFNGYDRPTTPHLEEFARDAVRFTDAWTPGGWTGPSHASLFTGLRPEHHGFHGGGKTYLDEGNETLAQRLRSAGWSTACFTNNEWIAPEYGLTRGFDRFEPLYARQDREVPWARETHALAAAWAQAQSSLGRPFLLFVNDMEPHQPYAPPIADQDAFVRGTPTAGEIEDVRSMPLRRPFAYAMGAEEISDRQLALCSDLYDAEIASLDREIGTFLARLRAGGLLDDTIVVIAGDHGESLGDHNVLGHGYDLHRAVRHVPLIVRWPGHFDGGRTVDSVVRLEDVAPTILELCGLAFPAPVDGVPLTRELSGRIALGMQEQRDGMREWLEAQVPGADGMRLAAGTRCVYDGTFDYILRSDGRESLYDVQRDPLELCDLSGTDRATVTRLRALLK